jgi:hypothetical protein
MKIAIMQPYFCPYIGYFQLMNAVDEFIVYDNIEFTKKGWINRNRILVDGKDSYITLTLKKASDYLFVKNRYLSDSWNADRKKMLNKIREAYRKAPFFNTTYSIIEKCILSDENNLFRFILNSLYTIKDFLGIKTSFVISSAIPIDHTLKAEKKVIEICKAMKSDIYVNPIGGVGMYEKENFSNAGIELRFLKTDNIIYNQFDNKFIPSLSIIDVMMFNDKEKIKIFLENSYTFI